MERGEMAKRVRSWAQNPSTHIKQLGLEVHVSIPTVLRERGRTETNRSPGSLLGSQTSQSASSRFFKRLRKPPGIELSDFTHVDTCMPTWTHIYTYEHMCTIPPKQRDDKEYGLLTVCSLKTQGTLQLCGCAYVSKTINILHTKYYLSSSL